MSLLVNDMILYIENFKDAISKLLELINGFGKVSEYKTNIQKFIAFLYTNKKKIRRKIKETISFIISPKKIKHLKIGVSKEAKDLYYENFKMLMKEIEDDTNRWKDTPYYLIGKSMLPK